MVFSLLAASFGLCAHVDVVVSWLPRSRYLSALESDKTSQCQHPISNPWDWYIYLHEWLKFMVNVGKYSSPMDPLGYGNQRTSFCFVFSDVSLETSLHLHPHH